MKKVIIIGAGIAGLTCGIYACINGFETEIYEQHSLPGGECTGWDRGQYHFDGCLHWLVGSKPGTSLNALWRDTGALNDSIAIRPCDAFARYEEGDAAVTLYTNADKLKAHLISIAPEDKRAINKLCADIRAMGGMEMPLAKPMDLLTPKDGLQFLTKDFGAATRSMRYGKMTMAQYVERFKNPFLKRAMLASFSEGYSAMAFLSTMAGMHAGDCGLPEGGSRALAKRMERRFLALGGRITYHAKIEQILVEGGRATGVRLADGSEAYSDYVVSCADAYATFMKMLNGRYTPELYKNLFAHPREYPAITCALVFMGIDAQLPHPCGKIQVRREAPGIVCGVETEFTQFVHYGEDETIAPEGKCVIACFYNADYDYWNAVYADRDAYRREKRKLEQDAIHELYRRFPEARGKVETTDVVTPMTYERYCGAWRGNWMSWMHPDKAVPSYFPGLLPDVANFLLAGMWTLPPGGLPGSAAAGRFAAHRLCLMNNLPFYTNENEVPKEAAPAQDQSETALPQGE